MKEQEVLEEGFVGMNNLQEDETSLTSVAKDLVPDGFVQKYKKMQKMKSELEEMENQVKQTLITMFESIPDLQSNTVCVDGLKFTYVKPSVRKTVDSKKLQEEYPDIYKKMLKESNVKSSLRTTIEY